MIIENKLRATDGSSATMRIRAVDDALIIEMHDAAYDGATGDGHYVCCEISRDELNSMADYAMAHPEVE